MGVRSFPHMIIYEDGQMKESIAGFYPITVMREVFTKYNKTS